MSSLRDLRKRLRAVKNTQKITKAMKMVAASKLRRAQMQVLQARPYAVGMQQVLDHVVSRSDVDAHPLLAARVPKKVEIVVMSSNRGLCGGFNASIIRSTERYIAEHREAYDEILLSSIGKKAAEHFLRKGWQLQARHDDVWDDLRFDRAADIARRLATRFRTGRLDAVYLLYNEFKSAISQNVVIKQLLPVQPIEDWQENPAARVGELAAISGDVRAVAGRAAEAQLEVEMPEDWEPSPALEFDRDGFEHIFEPSRDRVLDNLLPEYLAVQMWRALLESMAAEHGARMSAMDAASSNAKELIEKITLQANRVRQANITNELMEIVSGAETLNG